jgi:hypothetical protein
MKGSEACSLVDITADDSEQSAACLVRVGEISCMAGVTLLRFLSVDEWLTFAES